MPGRRHVEKGLVRGGQCEVVLLSPGHRRWRPDQVKGTGGFQAVKTEVAVGPAAPGLTSGCLRLGAEDRQTRDPGGARNGPFGSLTKGTRLAAPVRELLTLLGSRAGPREFGKAEQDRETQAAREAGVGAAERLGASGCSGRPAAPSLS